MTPIPDVTSNKNSGLIFLGYVWNILHFWGVYANLATQEKRPEYLIFGINVEKMQKKTYKNIQKKKV